LTGHAIWFTTTSGKRSFACPVCERVAQQTLNSTLAKALLPSPHRRPDANVLRQLLRRTPIRPGKHDARPLNWLRPIAVGRDRRQLLALGKLTVTHTF
jgi:hypothetical protein